MLSELLEQLEHRLQPGLRRSGVHLRPPLTALRVGDRPDRACYLVFSRGGRRPSLVAKVHRGVAGRRRLTEEHAALESLAGVPALQELVPRSLGWFETDDETVLAQTYLGGTSLEVLVRRRQRSQRNTLEYDLFRAQAWLQLFQEATASGVTVFPGSSAVWERLERLERTSGGQDDALRRLADGLADEAEQCRGLTLTLAGRHGQFEPRHVLVDGGQLNVIHWRHYTPTATAWEDLFRFVVGLAECFGASRTRPWDRPAAFSAAFLDAGEMAECAHGYVARYLRAMHLPEEHAHLFFGLFLLDHAANEVAESWPTPADGWLAMLQLYAAGAERSVLRPAVRARWMGIARSVQAG